MKKLIYHTFLFIASVNALAQITLIGENPPYQNINDGDFSKVWSAWRKANQSPNWKTKVIEGSNDKNMGVHFGTLYSMCKIGVAQSTPLITAQEFKKVNSGDVLAWNFDADLEYISNGTLTFSVVFGNNEVVLTKNVKLIGSDKTMEHFNGSYTITKNDLQAGIPSIKVTFFSSKGVKIFLDNVNVTIQQKSNFEVLSLEATANKDTISLELPPPQKLQTYAIYRAIITNRSLSYIKIGTTLKNQFIDTNFIPGKTYRYVAIIEKDGNPVRSNTVDIISKDNVPPSPPENLKTNILDTEIELSWTKSPEKDIAYYAVYRGDDKGKNFKPIAYHHKKNFFTDFTPVKEKDNSYYVIAYDYSGNKSKPSKIISGKVNTVKGTSFSDLILPMPIHKKLSDNAWGATGVIPRDIDNGMESPDWSYWGGRPVEGKDGKFHMCIARWPANATKGHWEWPESTVAHVIADKPTGPYRVNKSTAYDLANGHGHNPDIILKNDGSYLLYALINWEPVIFESKSMYGPWYKLGVIEVDTTAVPNEIPKNFYRFKRNLSGVQLNDGRFLFVTKAGAMMISKDENPLGPYKVVSEKIQYNSIIPEKYRNSNYEDPVLWKDEVQFHMIINAFLDYRAIHLRSPDGIHWKFNSGTAYTPNDTSYENGVKTHWYKLERPHILTDQYGRATHLSLAAIDVPKRDDLARDNHNSKNIILPLVKHRRLRVLNKKKIKGDTPKIRIEIISEEGFNAQKDIDLKSLRYGATEEVDTGRGCKLINTQEKGANLILEFDGKSNGITSNNFVGKLIGKTIKGDLIIGYSKLVSK